MPTPAEGTTGRRLALVVATSSYADVTLAKLRAPGQDASDLAAVLGDAAIGGFQVETVLDAPGDVLRRRVAKFCAQGGPHDLALVYLSCHGVLDDRGRLYYATVDTDRELLAATAVPSAWLNERLEDCRCRRQILVLDCCHSGAFAKGAKGDSALALGERFEGRGRVVLTGSRATEYSFEHDRVVGEGASSVFTSVLVEGLRSGDADRDGDGVVTVGELYDHAYEAVRTTDTRQTPTLWTYGAEGDLLVAQSPRGPVVKPEPLPEDLVALLESARPRVREGAVAELADLLAGPDPGRALTARAAHERVATHAVPQVAAAARAALDAHATPAPPAPPPPAEPPPPRPTDAEPPRPSGPPSRRRLVIAIAIAGGVAALAVAAALLAGGGSDSRTLGPGGIAVAGAPHGIAVGEAAVWVARHDDGRVSRIDPASGTESIEVGAGADRIVAGQGAVWVTVADGRKLVRIDPRTRRVTTRLPVDAAQPPGCGCPNPGLEIAEGALWAASSREGRISKRDLRTGQEVATPYELPAGFKGAFAVGGGGVWAVGTDDSSGDPRSWLVRIDIDSGEIKRIDLGSESSLSGVAYGEPMIWVADSADTQNTAIGVDPRTEGGTNEVKIDSGVTGDDIAVAAGAVLVWEPGDGILTRVDPVELKIAAQQKIRGYRTGQSANVVESDLEVASGSAWVSDPVGDAVYKVEY